MRRVWSAVKRRWGKLRANNPLWIIVVCAALFLYGTFYFFHERTKGGMNARISGDGRYHWAFVTSIVLDRDLDFANQYADSRSGNYWGYGKTATGRYANPFPMGPALVWIPLFLVGHGVTSIADPAEARGGNAELTETITLYSSFLCAVGAFVLAYLMARKRWGPGAAFAGAFTGLMCGPVLQYAINQPSFAHAPSAFAVALLWYTWDAGRGQRTPRGWALLGASLGFAMLCRAQNIIFAVPLVAEGTWRLITAWRAADGPAKAKGMAVIRDAAAPAIGAGVALLVFFPQMYAWHSIYGYWLGVPQGEAYMRFSESLWANTLFSSRNGLFPYAPLWAIGMLGLIGVARRDRGLAAALATTLFIAAFVNGAVVDWWAIGSMGGRRFDGLVIHAALGMAAIAAAFLRAAERRPRVTAGAVVATALALAATCNNVQIYDFQKRGRYSEGDHRDMLAHYNNLITRGTTNAYQTIGNPFSWPGAIAFHLRTGAPMKNYDLVVGPNFLNGFDRTLDDFQKRPERESAELYFGEPKHERYLVRGFADVRKDAKGKAIGRLARGPSARFLVPLNNVGGATMRLHATASAATTLHVIWNGDEVASLPVTPDQPITLPFTLTDAQIIRGVNIVDLRHDTLSPTQDAAVYAKLQMTSDPK